MTDSQIILLGYSHKNADIEFRDQLSLTYEKSLLLIKMAKEENFIEELSIVSTCNRTEFYAITTNMELFSQWLIAQYKIVKGIEIVFDSPKPHLLFGEKAVAHLCSVASGLESMILGENQILSQVKSSYELILSGDYQMPLLNKLFQSAIRAGKAVRTQTALCQGAVSISLAAVELSRKIFTGFAKRKILLIGAGETSELVANHFLNFGALNFIIANRTQERAQKLADKLKASIISLTEIPDILTEVDIIIAATNSQEYLLTYEQMKQLLKKRNYNPLLMLDISTPRNIDPRIIEYSEIFLYNIDDLQGVISANLQKRNAEIPTAKKLVAEICEEYQHWLKSLEIRPTITKLVQHFEEVREKELKKYFHKVSSDEYQTLERLSKGITKKFLHHPISSLQKMTNGEGVDLAKISLIYEIYNLIEKEQNQK